MFINVTLLKEKTFWLQKERKKIDTLYQPAGVKIGFKGDCSN